MRSAFGPLRSAPNAVAVQFDHQPSLDAAKIGDVRPYSMLSSEFRAQLSATQAHP
jgi:hypothetical protein